MRFQLDPDRRNVTEAALLEDLDKVCKRLGKDYIGEREYNANGIYSSGTFRRRFGSWNVALEKVGRKPGIWCKVVSQHYINDMRRVAELLGKRTLTKTEYEDCGKYSASAIMRRFGFWSAAIKEAGLEKSRNLGITEEEFFSNMEMVWTKLGRQPVGNDMRKPLSLYSGDAYSDRFGTWRKALERFVDYVNGETSVSSSREPTPQDEPGETLGPTPKNVAPRTRNISWRLRFLVMRRDGFRCQNCGRSPATEPGVVLHIDHDLAWSKGGPTTYDNLRTLCSKCNIAKSNLDSQ